MHSHICWLGGGPWRPRLHSTERQRNEQSKLHAPCEYNISASGGGAGVCLQVITSENKGRAETRERTLKSSLLNLPACDRARARPRRTDSA